MQPPPGTPAPSQPLGAMSRVTMPEGQGVRPEDKRQHPGWARAQCHGETGVAALVFRTS